MSARSGWLALGCLALFAVVASCSTEPTPREIDQDVKSGHAADAAKKLEQVRNDDPNDFDARLKLGEVYYEVARKSIDEDKQADYVEYLRKAQNEFLAAARLEPTSPRPHTWLGIITAYEGDLTGSETSFRNALRLAMSDRSQRYGGGVGGTYYSNLAHISVYKGDLPSARRYLDLATKTGAPQDEIDRISVLLSWKENDMVEARDVFNSAAELSKPFAETWDDAPLPKKMETFDDFAAVCCHNPTCGPHMESACKRERQSVAKRELELGTVQEQMKIERERRETLRQIYQKQKGEKNVEIMVDPDPNTPPATPPSNATPAPAPAPSSGSGTKR
jgi:tetratricopeptide (TPR) repeat protein